MLRNVTLVVTGPYGGRQPKGHFHVPISSFEFARSRRLFSGGRDLRREGRGADQFDAFGLLRSRRAGPDSVQVMSNGQYLYVGHMFSGGFTVVDVADPRQAEAGEFHRRRQKHPVASPAIRR